MTRGVLLELALFATAAVLFVVGFGLPEPATPAFVLAPREPGSLRVVTWNVGGSGQGGEWGRALEDEHVDHVARVLRELDPDLCFLQEVRMGRQSARLLDALGEGWIREPGPPSGGRRVVAFARRGSLEPLELAPDSRGSVTVLFSPDSGRPVVAVGLHADATSADQRNGEIGSLATALEQRDAARLLVGDLNIDLDLDKRRDLFTDDEYLDVETYNFVATRLRDAGRGTGSTAEPDRRLDYIFVDSRAFTVRSAGPLKDRRIGFMDHDPVAADLRWRD